MGEIRVVFALGRMSDSEGSGGDLWDPENILHLHLGVCLVEIHQTAYLMIAQFLCMHTNYELL